MAAFIASQRESRGIPHVVSCRAPGVSESWSCKWKDGDHSARRARRERLKAEVRRLFAAHKGKRGSPVITADLRDLGWRVSKNTVAAVMAEMGLAARPKKKRKGTTRPGKGRQDARAHRTWSSGTSRPPPSTSSGTATAPVPTPVRASRTSTRCWTRDHAGCWGSRWVSTTTRSWPTARW